MFAAKNELFTRPSGGYVIPRSLRFRSSATAYLNRTFGTPTDSTKVTFSAWIKRGSLSSSQGIFQAGNTNYIQFGSNDTIQLVLSNVAQLTTTPVFRDPSAWGHFVVSYNNAASPKWNFYYNSVNIGTSTASNTTFNTATAHGIANSPSGGGYFDGYMADVNFIDGQALSPTSFGAINATTGVWAPIKYTGTYGANGFHLDFNSYATTAALGTDTSGNGNTWTVNNISVTAGATYDSMIDVPTVSSTGSNYCVLNPLDPYRTGSPTDGNLAWGGGNLTNIRATFQIPTTGKWYWEWQQTNASPNYTSFGVFDTSAVSTATIGGGTSGTWGLYAAANLNTSTLAGGGGTASTGVATPALGVVYAFAIDVATGKYWCGYNSSGSGAVTWLLSGDPAAGTAMTGVASISSTLPLFPAITSNDATGTGTAINFGQRGFRLTVPSGYSALNTYNLPTPTILKGNTVMDATLYTGTGASLSVTNAAGFQPDLVWVKSRSAATDHAWYDSVRGVQKQIESNQTGAETTETTGLTAFGSTGFTVGALAQMNTSAATYVGWQWKGSGTTVSNASGTITSTVCVNPTAGFSVLTYTGVGATRTIGHSLGVVPSMVITKNKSANSSWRIYHAFSNATPQNYALYFDTSAATAESAFMNNTAPTSAVFTAGTNICTNAADFVSYCFAPIAGYSAFGSYTGNGSADGPFVFTGFRPRWVLFKSTSVNNWQVYDTAMNPSNAATTWIYPDVANAAGTSGVDIDILSNGFKLRSTNTINNASATTYIYAAFAESPFKNSLAR